jgi:hypothetical protein
MILRLGAAASLLLGVAAIMLYVMELGLVPWAATPRRHVRVMKDRIEVPARYESVSFDDMVALPRRAPIRRYAELERRAVTVEGVVQQFGRAPDGDYHLDVVPRNDPDGHFVPYFAAEITPAFTRGSATWTIERLAERLRPRGGTRTGLEQPPRRARVSGWLMYDGAFEGSPPLPGHPPIATSWEIHPVTRLEVWSDSLDRYEEIAR